MKRVFCLLLCLTLLCGLLPTAVLADGDPSSPLYFAFCKADGSNPEAPTNDVHVSFGETYYFRVYTAQTEGTQIKGEDGLMLSDAKEGELKWVSLSETDGYYVWNTKLTTNNMRTFSANSCSSSVYINTSVVGWYKDDMPSLSGALTYSGETEADVLYDGKTPVTVYLTAELSFVTNIEKITKSDNSIAAVPFDRTYTFGNETIERGQGLTVTCPEDLSDEQWVEVTVRQKFVNDPDTAYKTVTYKVTFSADGVSVNNPSSGRPGEPVLLPGITNTDGDQVYFGIGLRTDAGEYAVASSSRFTGPSTEQTTEVFKPCFFVKTTEGYTETAIDTQNFVISMQTPKCGETLASNDVWKTNDDGTYSFTLTHDMEGTWTISASCTVGETTYLVSCYSARVNAEEATIEGNDVASVDAINTKLKEVINGNNDDVKYCVVKLNSGEYAGTIEIPKETTGRVIVILQGNSDNPNNRTILNGGIKSDCDTVSVENIDFRGANYQENDAAYTEAYMNSISATWPNSSTPNYALYGSGRGNSVNCSFEGYKQAVVWTEGSRLLGLNNTYRYNDIGWYINIDDSYDNGLNTDANGSRFENNNYAIWAQSFGGFKYTNDFAIHVRENVFIDNECDVNNRSGRWWYIPGNYFAHGEDEGPDTRTRGESGTACYPTAQYDKNTGKVRNGYFYDQLNTTNGDRLSNALTSTYQIPAQYLDGKTYRVADVNDAGEDEVLATFSFPAEDTSTQSRRAAPMRARAAARTVTGFDATVEVDRSNADSIVFTMKNPLKTVNVKLPCTFESGTVTRDDGAEIKNAEFNGTNVSFDTGREGTYVITRTGAEPAVPGGASGSLIAGIAAAGSGSGLGASASQFSDLAAGSWYYEAVRAALKNGLMNGTSAHTFSPDMPMTRAMLVTILWRMAGQPDAKASPFTDVVSGSWYAKAVYWAYDRGLVTGVSETVFAPNEPVTREALVTILYRYAALKQNLPAAEDGAGRFADGKQVSAYARNAVNWALQTGLLTGVSKTKLSPKGLATRAQIAVLLERFLKL